MSEFWLDCKDMKCPVPIVRVSQAVKAMRPGEQLRIEASDGAFRADLEAWVRRLGHRLVEFEDGPVKRAVVEKIAAGDNG